MYSINKLARVVRRIFRGMIEIRVKLRQLLGRPLYATIGGVLIELPADSVIPMFQRDHPKYDKFLPHLVSFMKPDACVIDVGANVGDSLASMSARNSKVHYVCIEAFSQYYEMLLRNIKKIYLIRPDLKVKPVLALVGKSLAGVRLEGAGGSKHAVLDTAGSGADAKPLGEILDEIRISEKVRLIKSDVDGFDFDVINSSLDIIERDRPLMFFECQFMIGSQRIGFKDVILALKGRGYSDWVIFDNFGELMVRTSDVTVVFELIDYVWRQNIGNSTRTIWYFDMLCACKEDAGLINDVLDAYAWHEPEAANT